MKKFKNQFMSNECGEGQGMVEYALIVAGISIAAIGALTPVGDVIVAKFKEIGNTLTNAGKTTA